MKRAGFFLVLFILIGINIFSQDIQYKIAALEGKVDIRSGTETWRKPSMNEVFTESSEIFTGFHSQLSLEFGESSYLTINQFTHIKVNKSRVEGEEAVITFDLISGFVVLNTKDNDKYKNKVKINLEKDHVEFANSSGEIYYKKNNGAVVRSFNGMIKVGAKLSKMYFIKKGEACGIMPGGSVLENDYFLRREINTKPNNITDPHHIMAYYDLLFQAYSSEPATNDYSNNFRP